MTEKSVKTHKENPKELFHEVQVCSLEQSLEYCRSKKLFNSDKKHKWIFRGQQKKVNRTVKSPKREGQICVEKDDWKLETHLEKAFRSYKTDKYDPRELEKALIREFKRKAHHYIENVPDKDDLLEWLALMRHYGGPTRLLDWTYSFYVAVYLAVNECDCKKHKPEIWALNARWFTEEKVISEKSK